jgi:hypothetical protein
LFEAIWYSKVREDTQKSVGKQKDEGGVVVAMLSEAS